MLVNATPFAAQDLPYVDAVGADVVIAILKATYELLPSGGVVRATEPSPIRLVDVPWYPDAEQSSICYPSDMADQKVGADVVLIGDVISREPVEYVDASVRIGAHVVPLRVHGPRMFYHGALGATVGPAVKFERETLQYEKAYGGSAANHSAVEARNPVGTGLAEGGNELVDRPAPRIEHPSRPHRSWLDKHEPWGFGAIASHWAPRCNYFGTADAAWQRNRMPLFPLDFDPRYHNVAHPALQLPKPLQSGSGIGVVGMHEDGAIAFQLPEFRPVFTGIYASGRRRQQALVDTLLIEPNRRRFELVARASFPLGRTDLLREVRIDLEGAT